MGSSRDAGLVRRAVADPSAHGHAWNIYGGIAALKSNKMTEFRHKHLAAILLVIAFGTRVSAHNGPPFPIIEGKRVGPCVVALWTHPDVGIGTFFVILDAPPGGSVPKDMKVEIGVQPLSGRLMEVRYPAQREDLRGQIQYDTQVNFDADEIWKVHLLLHSASGDGEACATVEATPPGLGRWDLLWFAMPFLGAGFLWFKVATRKRNIRRQHRAAW
jgi:hypothetical protein